jgi:hypothetical protein
MAIYIFNFQFLIYVLKVLLLFECSKNIIELHFGSTFRLISIDIAQMKVLSKRNKMYQNVCMYVMWQHGVPN